MLKNVDKITLKNVENVGESLFILEHIKGKYLLRQKKKPVVEMSHENQIKARGARWHVVENIARFHRGV